MRPGVFHASEANRTMETPQSPEDPNALLEPQGQAPAGSKKTRDTRETMYGIELRRRMIRTRLIIAACVTGFVVILAAVAVIYPGTQGFLNRLDRMAANTTGADVSLQGVDLTPFQASIRQLDASWPDGGMLASLRAEHITASVMPHRYFWRTFGGDEVRASSGKLVLRYPAADESTLPLPDVEGKSRIAFDRIGIPKLDVQFGDASEARSASVFDAEAAFYPRGPGGLPRAMLYSGSLDIPFWPKQIIERAIVEFPQGSSRIMSMRILDGEAGITSDLHPGSCDVAGEIFHDPEVVSTLDIEFEGFRLQSLLGEEAGRFFVGRVDSRGGEDNGIVRISKEEGVQMRAELVASEDHHITFHHFPFLRFLSEALNDSWFLNPMFDENPSLVLIRDGAEIILEEINFINRHRMAIRGSLSINIDGEISGEIELGIAPGMIDVAIARRVDGMFSAEREGFRWITLELGGTTQTPIDDFNAQFIDAPMPQLETPPPPLIPSDLPPAPAPPPPAPEAAPELPVVPPALDEVADDESE